MFSSDLSLIADVLLIMVSSYASCVSSISFLLHSFLSLLISRRVILRYEITVRSLVSAPVIWCSAANVSLCFCTVYHDGCYEKTDVWRRVQLWKRGKVLVMNKCHRNTSSGRFINCSFISTLILSSRVKMRRCLWSTGSSWRCCSTASLRSHLSSYWNLFIEFSQAPCSKTWIHTRTGYSKSHASSLLHI